MSNNDHEHEEYPKFKASIPQKIVMFFLVVLPIGWYILLKRLDQWNKKHVKILFKINIGIVIALFLIWCGLSFWLSRVRGY